MHAVPSPGRGPLRLMRRLNLFGLDFLDPIVLAALADERPLLLIGPHGTAKSELLNRLAATLGLEHRHYNASLISFDDLLGYPVPDAKRGTVKYLRTPGDLWDAQCVFLDEISRCRPETQNKLFSVIHEKRVQGLALPKLRYRWAAMNPPLTAESDPEEAYEGSLPLDPALADRFAYVVELPALADLSPADRIALISRGGTTARIAPRSACPRRADAPGDRGHGRRRPRLGREVHRRAGAAAGRGQARDQRPPRGDAGRRHRVAVRRGARAGEEREARGLRARHAARRAAAARAGPRDRGVQADGDPPVGGGPGAARRKAPRCAASACCPIRSRASPRACACTARAWTRPSCRRSSPRRSRSCRCRGVISSRGTRCRSPPRATP